MSATATVTIFTLAEVDAAALLVRVRCCARPRAPGPAGPVLGSEREGELPPGALVATRASVATHAQLMHATHQSWTSVKRLVFQYFQELKYFCNVEYSPV